jgi:hypothetical protein
VDPISGLTEDDYLGVTFGTPGEVANHDGSERPPVVHSTNRAPLSRNADISVSLGSASK